MAKNELTKKLIRIMRGASAKKRIEKMPDEFFGAKIPEKIPPGSDIERFFKSCIYDKWGTMRLARWSGKDKKVARELVKVYGWEMTQQAIRHLIDSWDRMVSSSRGRLQGVPTIGFLSSSKDQIFGELQMLGRRKQEEACSEKNADEWTGEGSLEEGW